MPFDDPNEELYRAIVNIPHMWNNTENRPSSANFKSTESGTSVDRQGSRPRDIAISELILRKQNTIFRCVAYFPVEICNHKNICIKEDPDLAENNPHHCLLMRNPETAKLSGAQAEHLAKKCQWF